ncbi:MAG: hypothetical protein HC893_07925 [Chloroflexaceae bacterium]|nr:hypothetical protein [Chloroflexaceae bacterium]
MQHSPIAQQLKLGAVILISAFIFAILLTPLTIAAFNPDNSIAGPSSPAPAAEATTRTGAHEEPAFSAQEPVTLFSIGGVR